MVFHCGEQQERPFDLYHARKSLASLLVVAEQRAEPLRFLRRFGSHFGFPSSRGGLAILSAISLEKPGCAFADSVAKCDDMGFGMRQ
jgi:hypothetical protein